MKKTSNFIFISILFGALLLAGFFFNFKSSRVERENLVKPSQLNFANKNELPAKVSAPKNTATAAKVEVSSSTLQARIENLASADKVKWFIFEDILKSKNDNDPRLDQILRKLSPALHAALFEKYQSIPIEDRSGHGMIVYLIARDLNSPDDIDFLKKVYQEAPCLSLADCKTVGSDDPHHSSMNQTSLVIAQLEGLYAIERQLQDHQELLKNLIYKNGVVQILVQAESFPVAVVREKAQSIRTSFEL